MHSTSFVVRIGGQVAITPCPGDYMGFLVLLVLQTIAPNNDIQATTWESSERQRCESFSPRSGNDTVTLGLYSPLSQATV